MLRALHAHLSEHRTVTQRGLYYLLATSDNPLPHPRRGQPLLTRDRVGLPAARAAPRARPPPDADSREAQIRGPEGAARPLSRRRSLDVPGDIAAGEDPTTACSNARYVLIVEKDAVFSKLANERVWDRLPMVLVTAKGFPDLGHARFCVDSRDGSRARVLALVDWNPSGLLILQTYRSGRRRGARGWAIRARRRVAGGSVRGSERRRRLRDFL